MAELFYPLSFVAALSGLLFWSLWHNKRAGPLFRSIFFLGMALWIVTVISSPIEVSDKSGIILRDLLVLGVAGLAMQWARNNLFTGVGLLIVTGLFLQLSYLEVLQDSFQPSYQVDSDAELMVDVADDLQAFLEFIDQQGATAKRSFSPESPESTTLDEYYTIDLKGTAKPAEIQLFVNDLLENGLADWAETNELIRLHPEESETTSFSTQEMDGLVNDPEIGRQWGMKNLHIADLYETLSLKTVQPKKVALVAILDTGVDGQHEDLTDAYQSTKSSYDRDIQGHGTHVAGIVAGVSNNGIGIASFDPAHQFVKVTSIKVLSDRGFGTQEGIIKGMIEAADLGADVVSMSLGGRSNADREEAYEEAVRYCNNKGTIVVVAAGNSNNNARFYAPAKVDGVIAVAAIDKENARTSFSNWVSDLKYGLAAPGDEIYSTFPGNQYRSFRGTSMACPHVSSIVGILKSLQPDLNTEDIFNLLNSTGIESKNPKETGMIIYPAQAVRTLLD
ncbi:MAG: S8 family serine peptidase [Saprospiraceae bacterium]|nr:S8 family serine peptidase [Saprospiraceae bacterium]